MQSTKHKIKSVAAREILDSRGNPTIEVDLTLSDGSFGRAAVPSGASTGSHEARELRDNDVRRYGGKGVLRAAANVNEKIFPKMRGKEYDQQSLDNTLVSLDGTKNKNTLGANAILGVSMAFAKAVAVSEKISLYKYFKQISKSKAPVLPVPLMNIINGGAHAKGSTDIQEFMIVPAGARTFKEALRWGAEVFYALKKILSDRGLSTTVGDEGGFAPALGSNEMALELIMEAITKAGYKPGKDIYIALDVAATELYSLPFGAPVSQGAYHLSIEGKILNSGELIGLYESWVKKYPIISIEDGLAEDDWDGYRECVKRLGKKIQLVGDDLFVTNSERLKKGIDEKSANAILIKLNQIGTVSETIDTMRLARENGFASIVSHRSGETEDATIADFAVGLAAGQIKTGSLCRGERTAKYNQLLRIEEELGKKAVFAGIKAFAR